MGLLRTVLAIGIAILLTVFISYGLYVIYPNPQYGYTDTSSCFSQYACQNMTDRCNPIENNLNGSTIKAIPVQNNDECYSQVYASADYQKCMVDQQTCVDKLNQSSENYSHARNSFYILILLAIISMISGTIINKEGVGSGFIGGGVMTVLWALAYTTAYWTTMNQYLKLLAIGIVLIVLIWLGYKKIENKFSSKNK